MNRRSFFGAIAKAALGVAAVISLPASIFPAFTRTYMQGSAMALLTKGFNEFVRINKRSPKELVSGDDLFNLFEGEIVAHQRFVPGGSEPVSNDRGLAFKSCKYRKSGTPGYWVKFS